MYEYVYCMFPSMHVCKYVYTRMYVCMCVYMYACIKIQFKYNLA